MREVFSLGGDRAVFSDDMRYRYLLTRELGEGDGTVVFCMLNPSTADASANDPTIRRCIGYARSWDYARLEVVNLFAYRATKPDDMRRACDRRGEDIIGRGNDEYILDAAARAEMFICAWGAHGSWLDRGRMVLHLLQREGYAAHCLDTTKDGLPRHPLYLRKSLSPRLISEVPPV